MRLDFNVLWVEDQPQNVQSQLDRIKLQVNKEGFRLQPLFASSVVEATSYLSQNIYGDHIDMILMDYDLGAGPRGDDGLVEVRNIFPYKDIIFYSSKASDLRKLVAIKEVQGIYCSTREDLTDTVVGAFEALVKKVLDIDHSRGIVMGATSDIDHSVSDSLIAIFNSSDASCQSATLTVIARHIKDKRKDFEKKASQIEAVTQVSELVEKHDVYTSYDRLRLLKNALEINSLHSDKIVGITKYMNETVRKRNDLAHVRVASEGFSRKLIDRRGNEFTSEDMKTLRLELLDSQELFDGLLEDLQN